MQPQTAPVALHARRHGARFRQAAPARHAHRGQERRGGGGGKWRGAGGSGQSFSTGAYLSSSRLTPSDPKSMEATALSAVPSRATTVPRPNVSWWTRSPGSSEGISRAGLALAAASARTAAEEKLRRPAAVGEPNRGP